MRGLRVLSLVVVVVVFAAAAGGCGRHDSGAAARSASAPPSVPAPKNPDFSPVTERFYQMIEGKHWSIADQMLSPALRASFDEAALERRYGKFANADVHARQTGDRTVAATLVVPSSELRETLTFGWNGAEWQIERIAPVR